MSNNAMLSLALPKLLLRSITAQAKREKISRSKVIRKAIEQYLENAKND